MLNMLNMLNMYVVELRMFVEGKIVWTYMCNDRGMMR
jgi:hypothetical protein